MTKVIQSLWIDSVIDEMQVACIKSFLSKGHEFHLYKYNDIVNVPTGVIVKDANMIINQSFIFKDKFNSYATFSDWFRIKLVYELGGWWVDCDVLCLKKFDTNWPYVFATEIGIVYDREIEQICNAVFKMPKKSSLGKSILNIIEDRLSQKMPDEIYWTEIGAKIMAPEIFKFKKQKYIVSPEVFCPINYFNYKDVGKSNLSVPDSTFGIHIWNKMWEWNREDPVSGLKNDSLLGKFLYSFNLKDEKN